MAEDFSANIVKEYPHWTVSVYGNQGYLGRLVIWCKRADALDLADALPEEREEFFVILNDVRAAFAKTFKPDWLNYAFLGNGMRHLHCHLIPRYASPRTFAGTEFVDNEYGNNYKTDPDFVTTPDVLAAVRDQLKEVL